MAIDIPAFLNDENALALRFESKDLPGLLNILSKELSVPEGCVALVTLDREEKLLRASESQRGNFSVFLVKTQSQVLDFNIPSARSRDDIAISVDVSIEIQPRVSELDLAQLRENVILRPGSTASKDRFNREDLCKIFQGPALAALRFYLAARDAEVLLSSDQRLGIYQHCRQELQKTLLETGFDLRDLRHPTLRSSQFDEIRRRKVEVRVREESLVQAQRMEMLRKELDKEVLLKDLEAQDEVERRRKEARLGRFEEMRQRMGEDDVKALVMMLDDDSQRAALIKELIEKDMSPEQRANIKANEVESRLEARLAEFRAQVGALTGAVLEARADDPKTRRVLAVIGKRVLSFDPSTNLHPEVAKEVYDTSSGSLGYLRSVRHMRRKGEDVYLFGAQRGVYVLQGKETREYVFGKEAEGKGGANGAAMIDGRLFASHSEVGMVEWSEARPGVGVTILEEVTQGSTSVRGVTVGPDGRLYFSVGAEIVARDLLTDRQHAIYKGSRESITAFLVERDKVLAGTKSGQILEWRLDDPGSPREAPMLKRNPIYMLRRTRIAGTDYLIIGSKDHTVTLANFEKELFREYHAREEVRWVDGAGDFIAGVSRSGYKIFIWDVQKQSEPSLQIRVSDKVQDLLMTKSQSGSDRS